MRLSRFLPAACKHDHGACSRVGSAAPMLVLPPSMPLKMPAMSVAHGVWPSLLNQSMASWYCEDRYVLRSCASLPSPSAVFCRLCQSDDAALPASLAAPLALLAIAPSSPPHSSRRPPPGWQPALRTRAHVIMRCRLARMGFAALHVRSFENLEGQ